ncbi:MAG TPA: hypothetical protein PLJ77_02850 [Dokdonella sp.]|uniref:hypothetical protein n=1 Tax=Dokdonella sp. TaxID=2291710 RepID=UPI002C53150B|nr:hypothetical protein [Xanthomonadales bacterium]HQV72300.1 hypothetical protein [Dokdonella sp.]HQW75799.1 hypothetical protein [Dokdonella sp.]HQY55242.1 hypothetical protein [Dokdonella sp.]HQZ62138.1 hypothetical protein [Dokdonella sp.]
MNPRLMFLPLIAVLIGATQARAAVVSVGNEPACSFGSLQQAMAFANSNGQDDEIRIANTMQHTHVSVEKHDADRLTIAGGYASCSSALPLAIPTVLDGSGSNAPVIRSVGGYLSLRNLQITGGRLDGSSSSGGGVDMKAPALGIDFRDVRITLNSAASGGGVAIIGSPSLTIRVRAENLRIDRNDASGNGGGLFAAYANGQFSSLQVEDNRAGNDGGGIWLGNDAVFHNRTGKTRSGIFANHAGNRGGGIAIEGGAMEMYHVAAGTDPAVISNNSARVGGAISIFNDRPWTAAVFNGSGINVVKNTASREGGAIAISVISSDSAPVFGGVHFSAAPPAVGGGGVGYCDTPRLCNVFSDNAAIDEQGSLMPGAVVAIHMKGKEADGFARFWNSTWRRNFGYDLAHSESDVASVWAQEIQLLNTLVDDNLVEKNLINATGFGSIYVMSSTVTGNRTGSALISGEAANYLRGSIFTDDAPLLSSVTPGTAAFNLIVANDDGLAGMPQIEKADPRFADPANHDYQLRMDSPALDREWGNSASTHDLDGEPRDVDLTYVPDFNMPRDLGCFERQF